MLLLPLFALSILFGWPMIFATETPSSSEIPEDFDEIIMKIERRLAKQLRRKTTGDLSIMKQAIKMLKKYETRPIQCLIGSCNLLIEPLKVITSLETEPFEDRCYDNIATTEYYKRIMQIPPEKVPLIRKMVSFYTERVAADCRTVYVKKFAELELQLSKYTAIRDVKSNLEEFLKAHLERPLPVVKKKEAGEGEVLLYSTFVLHFKPLDSKKKSALIKQLIDPKSEGFASYEEESKAHFEKLIKPCQLYTKEVAKIFEPATRGALLMNSTKSCFLYGFDMKDFFLGWARFAICKNLIKDYEKMQAPS